MPRFQVDDPTQQTAPAFEEMPDGAVYNATITEISVRTHARRDGSGDITFLDWSFIVMTDMAGDDTFAGRKVRGSTLAVLKTNGGELDRKLYNWASNVLGMELQPGANFDTDDLIGLEVQVEIGYEPDRKDPSRKWARVFNVLGSDGSSRPADPWATGGIAGGDSTPPF